ATIMLRRAGPNGAASDSFFHRCGGTPHSAPPLLALRIAQRRATARMGLFARFKIFRDGTEPGAKRLARPRARGETALMPNYRRIQTGKHRPLKSGRQNGVVPQRKEPVVKGRMMLFVVSILAYQFSSPLLTPSAANQTGVASVYSHESGSGTA